MLKCVTNIVDIANRDRNRFDSCLGSSNIDDDDDGDDDDDDDDDDLDDDEVYDNIKNGYSHHLIIMEGELNFQPEKVFFVEA
ncbi:hypothetical protein ElyMa_000336700 [Elysia marginata]|uniref:Uncharacterized protein n=1 Tax=Elysia marginata TaxID=1093978 RepID=A0AAV4FC02_9GAST|nr:hypothetical protein ElyMa_000336700 [Elysia marginata]